MPVPFFNFLSAECARLAPIEIESADKSYEDSCRYYAKPGEAEWGC